MAKKELAETKNTAEHSVHLAEKSLVEYGSKVSPELKSEVETKISTVKTALAGGDKHAIAEASGALSVSLQKIGEAMAKANPTPGENPPNTPPGGESDTRDADFESGTGPTQK